MDKKDTTQKRLILEASWEVCNKVGGIYTVLTTKAQTQEKLHKGATIYFGPDIWTGSNPSPWFEEGDIPAWLAKALKTAKMPWGITVRAGRWLTQGRPVALLVGFDGVYEHLNEMQGKMWEWFGVDSLHGYGDYPQACAWGIAVAIVMQQIAQAAQIRDLQVLAQFHEWTTGMALLLLKHFEPEIPSVFTTHATSIGRSICGNGKPLYSELAHYNGNQMALELNMEAKHSLEKTAAHQATVFTTVSQITAREAKQLIEREPEVVTLNGIQKVAATGKRAIARQKFLETASKMKGREFNANTFIIATGGRSEFRNKGLDIFLDAVNALKQQRKEFLAFVLVPGDAQEPVDHNVLTHRLRNQQWDAIYNRITRLGIEDNIIYVPVYLNGDDGVFNMPYLQLLYGADATVFPSYYEPWGYTPLESIARGVPTITTSLAGFGQWILDTTHNTFLDCGVKVIERNDYNDFAVVTEIVNAIDNLMAMSPAQRRETSKAALATARHAGWDQFIANYEEAYNLAMKKCGNANPKKNHRDKQR